MVPYLCSLLQKIYLCKSVKCFFELQVLSSFAGQIHPLSFKPLNVWFTEEIFGLHFGNEADISTFRCRKRQSKWLLAAWLKCVHWPVCVWGDTFICSAQSLFSHRFTQVWMWLIWRKYFCSLFQLAESETVPCNMRYYLRCLQPWTTVSKTATLNG